jgi:hypothetical protein
MFALAKTIAGTLYRWWMAFAHALGYVNTKALLTIFYLLILAPVWLICSIFRVDFLDRRWRRGTTYWREKESTEHTQAASRRQF